MFIYLKFHNSETISFPQESETGERKTGGEREGREREREAGTDRVLPIQVPDFHFIPLIFKITVSLFILNLIPFAKKGLKSQIPAQLIIATRQKSYSKKM